MKKIIKMTSYFVLILLLSGCGNAKSGDYPATIMVNGTNYYSTGNTTSVKVDKEIIQYTNLMQMMVFLKRTEKKILIEMREHLMQFLVMAW